jgi:hypothetical protein
LQPAREHGSGLYASAPWRLACCAALACAGLLRGHGALAQAVPTEPVAPAAAAQEPAPPPAAPPPAAPPPAADSSEESAAVEPVTGTVDTLPSLVLAPAVERGSRLDRLHDRVYVGVQRFLRASDNKLAADEQASKVVPLSPLRVGVGLQLLHRGTGWQLASTADFDATLQFPNLRERYRLFISSGGIQESPDAARQGGNPLLAGVRLEQAAHVSFDLGVHLKLVPSAFTAARWAPGYNLGQLQVFPFAKAYVETGVGPGASGGLTLEHHWKRWIARSSSFADWRRNAAATSWTQSLVFGYARAVIRERRYDLLATGNDLACGAMMGLSVTGDRASHASAYEANVLLKRALHGGWLYGYVEPVVRWERIGGWHPDAGLRIGIDVLFWGPAAASAQAAGYCH